MALGTLGNLVIRMSADIADIATSISKAEHQFQKFKGNVNKILGTIGVGISVGSFASFIKGTIDAADALNDLRKRTGQTGQDLLVLQGAAVRGGVGMEAVSGVVSKLSTRMIEAAKGTGDAAAAYQAMGISVKNTDGSLKNNIDLLREVGDRFRGYEDGANKAALANAALGKGGDALIPVIEALRETEERFKRLGIAISDDLLQASDEFNDKIADAKSLIDALGRVIASALLPYLDKGVELLIKWAKATNDTAEELRNGSLQVSNLKTAIDATLVTVKVFTSGFLTLYAAVAAIGEVLVGVSQIIDTRISKQFSALGNYYSALFSGDIKGVISASKDLISLDFSDEIDLWSIALERAGKRIDSTAGLVSDLFSSSSKGAQEARDNWDLLGSGFGRRFGLGRRQAPGIPDLAAQKGAQDSLQQLLDQRTKLELEALRDLNKHKTALPSQSHRRTGLLARADGDSKEFR
jgi:hypothetical protein